MEARKRRGKGKGWKGETQLFFRTTLSPGILTIRHVIWVTDDVIDVLAVSYTTLFASLVVEHGNHSKLSEYSLLSCTSSSYAWPGV